MQKLENPTAEYYSEDKIAKMKNDSKSFKEQIKKDEKRIIAEYLSKRIIRFDTSTEPEKIT